MSSEATLVANLVAAARSAARAPEVGAALRKRLAICAIEVVRADAWDALDGVLQTAPADVQGHAQDALEYAVEHPVMVSREGKAYNGRLFVLPVSQVLQGSAALGYLPHGETIQQLLTDALCPGGLGILLNRLLPEAVLNELTLKDVWTMTGMAFDRFEPGSAEPPETPFIQLGAGESSGLHFVPFLAFAHGAASDELLSLEGDELSVRALAVMEAINPLISQACFDAGQPDVHACVHVPLSFFYEPVVVDLAHESFLFAVTLNQWMSEAEDEGRTLTLKVSVERETDRMAVVVDARDGRHSLGMFSFAVDLDDEEMVSEVCASVTELARPHEVSVELPASVRPALSEAYDPASKTLAFVEGPSTLQ